MKKPKAPTPATVATPIVPVPRVLKFDTPAGGVSASSTPKDVLRTPPDLIGSSSSIDGITSGREGLLGTAGGLSSPLQLQSPDLEQSTSPGGGSVELLGGGGVSSSHEGIERDVLFCDYCHNTEHSLADKQAHEAQCDWRPSQCQYVLHYSFLLFLCVSLCVFHPSVTL